MHFHQIWLLLLQKNSFFVLIKKQTRLWLWAAIFYISYAQILYNEPFNKIRSIGDSIFDWVSEILSEKLWKHGASAKRTCQIMIINSNSAQFEKLDICLVCYITNWGILEFISSYFTTYKVGDTFFKNTTFWEKGKRHFHLTAIGELTWVINRKR